MPTATYDPTLVTARDRVRFALGDTDLSDPQLSNEEIDALVTLYGEALAFAEAADALARRFALLVDVSVGGTRLGFKERADAYAKLATTVRRSAVAPVPEAGGIDRRPAFSVTASPEVPSW